MDKSTFDSNVELEKKSYDFKYEDFINCSDKDKLKEEYKSHNLRFSLIIKRNIAKEKGNIDYYNFLDSVINEMTNEISLVNKSNEFINTLSFHNKVNIIFYVRPTFYDSEFEPYEILNESSYKELANSIIDEANVILKEYNIKLNDVRDVNLYNIIDDKDLCLDILFASELIK